MALLLPILSWYEMKNMKGIMKKNVVLLSLLFLIAPPFALAADYYVSPTGTATWAECTNVNTPCGGKTAAINAVAGDTIYFRGGTYDPASDPVQEWIDRPDSLKYERLPWNPQNSGTSGNPITFKAYPGETPVFIDNVYGGAFGAAYRDWIVWDGFNGTIVDRPGQTIGLAAFWNANNCIIRNSNLTGILKGDSKNSGLIRADYSRYLIIENNVLHDMNDGVNAAGVFNFYSYDMIVRNNDIYNNYLGIWDKDTEQNNQYYNNHIWGGNDSSTRCMVGIQINDQAEWIGAATDAKAYQNVIRNCDTGIYIYTTPIENYNVSIHNNVIINNAGTARVGILASQWSRGAQVYDNIVYGYPVPLRYYSPTATTINFSDNNNYFNSSNMAWNIDYSTDYSTLSLWTAATGFDTNSLTSNPLFVNAGGTNPSDYMLNSGSPAKSAGRNGKDIGAFPDGSLILIGVIKPSPPADLSIQ